MNIEELKSVMDKLPREFLLFPIQVTMIRPDGRSAYTIRNHIEPSIQIDPSDYWEDGHKYTIDEYGYIQPDEYMDCDQWRPAYAKYMALTSPKMLLEVLADRGKWKESAINNACRSDYLEAQRDELLAALKEARELVEDWGAYAPAYMQEKHDLHGDLSRLDAAIAKAEG